MIDPVAISSIIISSIVAISVLIARTHLRHIFCCGCIESDCADNNNNNHHLDPDIIEMNNIIENKNNRDFNNNIKKYIENTITV
jgi:hypothetical protein